MGELAKSDWRALISGRVDRIGLGGPLDVGPLPDVAAVLSGAFNPLHDGHQRMAATAAGILRTNVHYELSIHNVDKSPLGLAEVTRRVSQFDVQQTVWLTRAATFAEKVRLFPGATFVVGLDTISRIAEPRYHGGDKSRWQEAISTIDEAACSFLVFGRLEESRFQVLSDLELPTQLRKLCQEVSANQFRADVSSTELRTRGHYPVA